MEFTFLGTSSGAPTKQRNVTGLAISSSSDSRWILVDCGEGTQHRLQYTPYSLSKLEAICITHVHGDHCYGLPGLLSSISMAGRSQPLRIIAPEPIRIWLTNTLYLTDSHVKFDLKFGDSAECLTWPIGGFTINIWPLSHRVPSYGYSFEEANVAPSLNVKKLREDNIPQGPLWGQIKKDASVLLPDGRMILSDDYLVRNQKPRRVVVGGDNDSPHLLSTACQGADVLIHESTYTEDVREVVGDKTKHSSAKSVANFAAEADLPNLILTHFSARYKKSLEAFNTMEQIRQEASTNYQGRLFLAEDLERYELNKSGSLSLAEERC